jgi:hypothetical protein
VYGVRTGRRGSCGAEEISYGSSPISWSRGTRCEDRQPNFRDGRLLGRVRGAGLADVRSRAAWCAAASLIQDPATHVLDGIEERMAVFVGSPLTAKLFLALAACLTDWLYDSGKIPEDQNAAIASTIVLI